MKEHQLLRERWEEVDALIERAIELPCAERIAMIKREVAESGPFKELTLRLVANLDREVTSIASPSHTLLEAAFHDLNDRDAGDLSPGTPVSAFTVVERIGRGGMATVYAADRTDGAYEQRVALKVLRRGLDTDDLIRRFRTERQILSTLTHPNIARLVDGGALEDGRPWLAMELVCGHTIIEYAKSRELPLRARLQLFLATADAVQDAHRQLVVHRDIKPSNVLVDTEGRVRLLDFGIAKLLDAATEHTDVGMRPLTRAYAAPEQLTGGQITTATDVYQLGLVLRELLGASQEGALSGDLKCVIGKALRDDAVERYASAGDMAADVRAYLAGRSVSAHPESVRYRLGKFIARNRMTVLAMTTSAVLLGVYALTITVQSRALAAARDAATAEAQKAAEVSEFMVSLFRSADPDTRAGAQMTAAELLTVGARQLQDDPVSDWQARAAIHAAIGRSLEAVGAYSESEQQLEAALATYDSVNATDPAVEATVRHRLAMVVMHRDLTRALEILSEARTKAESVLGSVHPMVADMTVDYAVLKGRVAPGDPSLDSLLVGAVQTLRAAGSTERARLANALTVWGRGQAPELAIPRMREALQLRRAIHPELHTAVATSLSDLALATEPVDAYAADTLLTQAVAILRQVQGTRGVLVLTVMNNLAAVRRDRGAFAAALPLYREVLSLRRELYPEHLEAQAYTLYGLGVVLTGTGHAEEAVHHLREGSRILDSVRPGSTPAVKIREALQRALAEQGRL